MCLNNGVYNHKKIVLEEWIKESANLYYQCKEEYQNMRYGYLWWLLDKKEKSYAPICNSGNVIYINPSKNIVVIVTVTFKPTAFYRIQFIRKYIEPYKEDNYE